MVPPRNLWLVSGLHRRVARTLQSSAQSIRIDVVDESALTADLDHGQPFPVLRLEPGIARDVDLRQLERHLGADEFEHASRTLAEVALRGVVEDDVDYG
jgi:hypothetical protein